MSIRKDLSQLLISLLTIKNWGSIKEGCGCLCLSSFWWILPGFAKDRSAVAYLGNPLQPARISIIWMSEIHPAPRHWTRGWGVKLRGYLDLWGLTVSPIDLLPQVFVFDLLENNFASLILLKKFPSVSISGKYRKIPNAIMTIIYLVVSASIVCKTTQRQKRWVQ